MIYSISFARLIDMHNQKGSMVIAAVMIIGTLSVILIGFQKSTVTQIQVEANRNLSQKLQNVTDSVIQLSVRQALEYFRDMGSLDSLFSANKKTGSSDGFQFEYSYSDNDDDMDANTDSDEMLWADIGIWSDLVGKRSYRVLFQVKPFPYGVVNIWGDLRADLSSTTHDNPDPSIISYGSGCGSVPSLVVDGDINCTGYTNFFLRGDVVSSGNITCDDGGSNTILDTRGPTPSIANVYENEPTIPKPAGLCDVASYESEADLILEPGGVILDRDGNDVSSTFRASSCNLDTAAYPPLYWGTNPQPHWHLCNGGQGITSVENMTIYSKTAIELSRQTGSSYASGSGQLVNFNPVNVTIVSEEEILFWMMTLSAYHYSLNNSRKTLFVSAKDITIGNSNANRNYGRYTGIICADDDIRIYGGGCLETQAWFERDNRSGIDAGCIAYSATGNVAAPVLDGMIFAFNNDPDTAGTNDAFITPQSRFYDDFVVVGDCNEFSFNSSAAGYRSTEIYYFEQI